RTEETDRRQTEGRHRADKSRAPGQTRHSQDRQDRDRADKTDGPDGPDGQQPLSPLFGTGKLPRY
ncbi:hypothetical protein K504DRAFT_467392, partial [Pleomassaria siparia CBS 279.74]